MNISITNGLNTQQRSYSILSPSDRLAILVYTRTLYNTTQENWRTSQNMLIYIFIYYFNCHNVVLLLIKEFPVRVYSDVSTTASFDGIARPCGD